MYIKMETICVEDLQRKLYSGNGVGVWCGGGGVNRKPATVYKVKIMDSYELA